MLSVTVSNLINQIWLIRNSVAKKSKIKLNGKAVSRDPRDKPVQISAHDRLMKWDNTKLSSKQQQQKKSGIVANLICKEDWNTVTSTWGVTGLNQPPWSETVWITKDRNWVVLHSDLRIFPPGSKIGPEWSDHKWTALTTGGNAQDAVRMEIGKKK